MPDRPHPRFFPFPSRYTTNGKTTQFSYIKPLDISEPACVTFLAEINPNSDLHEKVVVKFVQTYGEDAHQLLAQLNLAPKLHYCGSFGVESDLNMVVMAYVEGKTAAESFGDDPLSENIVRQLSTALDALNSHGYVFGDLRRPNIMITDENKELRLVDFDWSGQEKIVRYPPHLSKDVKWADGVGPHKFIERQHDWAMLELLK